MLGGQESLAELALKLGQATAPQERFVLAGPGDLPLLGGDRQDPLGVEAEEIGDRCPQGAQGAVDRVGIAQSVPQQVHLAERHQQRPPAFALQAAEKRLPALQVAAGHGVVRRQDQQDRLGPRDQGVGQLGLLGQCTRIRADQNDQTLPQQRMRKAHHGVTPFRNLDPPSGRLPFRGEALIGKTEPAGLGPGNHLGLPDRPKGPGQLLGRLDVEGVVDPAPRVPPKVRERFALGPALHREQAKVGLVPLIVPQQLRGASGAIAVVRGEQAPAEVGKEKGIDQLWLAPGGLPDHRDRDTIATQQIEACLDPLTGTGSGPPVVREPALQLLQRLDDPPLPPLVMAETLLEG